jgi:hypothetical protein
MLLEHTARDSIATPYLDRAYVPLNRRATAECAASRPQCGAVVRLRSTQIVHATRWIDPGAFFLPDPFKNDNFLEARLIPPIVFSSFRLRAPAWAFINV